METSTQGQERVAETVRPAKVYLAAHGLAVDIRPSNTHEEMSR